MHTLFARRRPGTTACIVAGVVAAVLVATAMWSRAESATITASYESGYLDVSINGYGTSGMGTFRLDDAGVGQVALCVQADEHHSTDADAYAPVDNRIASPELDVLIWLLSHMPTIDADTGIAAAALAWLFGDAQRTIGVPVWADGHNGFAPITPTDPERWDALAPYGLSHLVGLQAEGVQLDQAERRVLELYDTVVRLAGPWAISVSGERFRLTGASGPIAGQTITIGFRESGGATTSTLDLVTDADGFVTPAIPAMPAGGSVVATATSPGAHREWDGSGDVQRLVTATDGVVSAELAIPPRPAHLLVVKRSADPTIGVAGAVFSLLDGTGGEIERVTTTTSGEARFAPVDAGRHPGPFTLHEVSAPPGLLVTAPDQTVPTLSSDAAAPTVLIMTDAPRTVPVELRKRLSVDGVGPPDQSGFEFEVKRRSDGWATRVVTGPDGITPPVEVALGDYDTCETAVPEWATALVDEGCVTISVTLAVVDGYDEAIADDPSQRPPFTVEYVNAVPPPSIVTSAHDPADGDRFLETAGGRVVDVVSLQGLVPGTAYAITGELVPPGGRPTDPNSEGNPLPDGTPRVTGRVDFTAFAPSETHEVEFVVPASGPGRYVIVERLWVGEHVVAEHADLSDELQTIEIVPTTTTSTTSTTTTSTTSTMPPVPPPTTTATTTTTTTTSTTAAPTTTTATTVAPSTTAPLVTAPPPPPTLPQTGSASSRRLLRVGDVVLLIGIVLVVATRLAPRRRPLDPHADD